MPFPCVQKMRVCGKFGNTVKILTITERSGKSHNISQQTTTTVRIAARFTSQYLLRSRPTHFLYFTLSQKFYTSGRIYLKYAHLIHC